MNFCLNKEYLENFLKFQGDNVRYPLDDSYLAAIIDGASNWSYEVNLIVYFFSTYLQKKINGGTFDVSEIDTFYDSVYMGNFTLQEFDRNFIEFLFDYSRSKMNMTLEEMIIKIQEDYSDKLYASDFRYWYRFFY